MDRKEQKKATQKLLIISAVVDFSLGAIKILVGLLANSYALVIDGIHSLSDLLTDFIVWVLNAIGSQEPDEDHPYGHARFETFGTFALGSLLVLVAAYIVYESSQRIIDLEQQALPSWPALAAALISIAAKEWLFRVTLTMGKRFRSKLLQANAWHHRTDSLSSVIVLVGITGALFGFAWLEMLAAIGVGILIAAIGWDLIKNSVAELVDTALSDSYVNSIRLSIEDVEGVTSAHSIRTRRMGSDVIVEVHLQVTSTISVSEGHHIGEWVSKNLKEQYTEINDVIVHIDAEDDATSEARDADQLPPLRKTVRTTLLEAWQPLLDPNDIVRLDLHYLNSTINVELLIRKTSAAPNSGELQAAANNIPWLGRVSIWRTE